MKPTLLITGGSGLLALNWAMAVRDRYAVVLGCHERRPSLAGAKALQVDLESVDALARDLEKIRPDVIVHAAGLTDVAKCEEMPELARHVNVTLAENVARAAHLAGAKLIHVSTDHLFAGDTPMLGEEQSPAPLNVYGRTKADAERQVLAACPGTMVMRTNFYGWGPAYRRSFSDVVIDGLRGGKPLTLYSDVFYTPILIDEAVKAAHELLDRGASGIFNLVGDERVSKHEFGLRIAREFRLDSSIIQAGLLAGGVSAVKRPQDMSLSNHKVRARIGRGLGGVDQHIAQLRQQEQGGFAREIRSL